MAAKYFCDVCEAPLSPVGTAPDGTIEGSGVRSVDPAKGWERCALGLAARHLCVICGFGIADAFKRTGFAAGPPMPGALLLKDMADWWDKNRLNRMAVSSELAALMTFAQRAYNITQS